MFLLQVQSWQRQLSISLCMMSVLIGTLLNPDVRLRDRDWLFWIQKKNGQLCENKCKILENNNNGDETYWNEMTPNHPTTLKMQNIIFLARFILDPSLSGRGLDSKMPMLTTSSFGWMEILYQMMMKTGGGVSLSVFVLFAILITLLVIMISIITTSTFGERGMSFREISLCYLRVWS